MIKPTHEQIAAQLRKPHGNLANEVTEFMERSNRKIYELGLRNLNMLPGDSLIEIGPANGAFTDYFFNLESDIHYTGIDYSDDMIQEANERNSKLVKEGKAEFVFGDVVDVRLGKKANQIFSVNTIYFWEDPLRYFRWANDTLTEGGQFIVCFRSGSTMQSLPFTQYGFRLYESESVKKLFSDSGFSNIHIFEEEEEITSPEGKRVTLKNICGTGEKIKFDRF